jgi:outer membrane protein
MKSMGTGKMGFGGLSLVLFLSFSGWAFAEDVLPPPGKPLTLDQCVAIALKYHPSLQSSEANVQASKATIEQALSAYYPQVNLNNSYTAFTTNFSTSPISNPAGGAIGVPSTSPNRYRWTFTDVVNTGLAASQTIWDFGRTSNNVKINRENTKASEEDLVTTRQTVILNVKTAFYGVLQTQYLIDVAQDVVTQTKQHLEQAQGFYQAGTRPKIDVTKAEVDQANAELALIQGRNNFAVARATLNNAIGLRQNLTFAIEKEVEVKPQIIPLEEILMLLMNGVPRS